MENASYRLDFVRDEDVTAHGAAGIEFGAKSLSTAIKQACDFPAIGVDRTYFAKLSVKEGADYRGLWSISVSLINRQ